MNPGGSNDDSSVVTDLIQRLDRLAAQIKEHRTAMRKLASSSSSNANVSGANASPSQVASADTVNPTSPSPQQQQQQQRQQEQEVVLDDLRRQAAAVARDALSLERGGAPASAAAVLTHGASVFSVDSRVRALMYNNLACVEKRSGDAAQAVLHLEDAIDCEGGEECCPPSTLLNLSATVLSMGYYPAAVRVAQQAVRRLVRLPRQEVLEDPHTLLLLATARYNLGVALRELGDIVKGRGELERAKDIFVDHAPLFAPFETEENRRARLSASPVAMLSNLREHGSSSSGGSPANKNLESTPKHEQQQQQQERSSSSNAAGPNKNKKPVDQEQVARLKAVIDAALSLPFHEGGASPARAGRSNGNHHSKVGAAAAAAAGSASRALVTTRQENGDEGGDHESFGVTTTPPSKKSAAGGGKAPGGSSSSKFSHIRALRSPGDMTGGGPGTPIAARGNRSNSKSNHRPQQSAAWDSRTSIEANNRNRHQRPRNSAAATPHPGSSSQHHHLFFSDASSPTPTAMAPGALVAALVPTSDPSVELRLAGTYVPIRLVRLTEEVRFRESCRRIALARARAEDLHDMRLLMHRERLIAHEEQQRVELEVEQERLFGVMCYWIRFRTQLIRKASILGGDETQARNKIVGAHEAVVLQMFSRQAQLLLFQCEQDAERWALMQQEVEVLDNIERLYAERNTFFEAKAVLSLTQMRALACALSTWAFDNALRGENTVLMLRPEMQQSSIVLLRSLTFGPGKWAKRV